MLITIIILIFFGLIFSKSGLNSIILLEMTTIIIICSLIEGYLYPHLFLLAVIAAIGAAIGVSLINSIVSDSRNHIC